MFFSGFINISLSPTSDAAGIHQHASPAPKEGSAILPHDDAPSGFALFLADTPLESLVVCVRQAVDNIPELKGFRYRTFVNQSLVHARSINSDGKLTEDEAAAICFYTVKHHDAHGSINIQFYKVLNKAMREKDISTLHHFKPYLRLLMTAFNKLPLETVDVYRGVDVDLHPSEGSTVQSYQFYSTSTDETQARVFLSESGSKGTLQRFRTEAISISKYSKFPIENEHVILPGFKHHVEAVAVDGNVTHNTLSVVKAGKSIVDIPHPMFFQNVRDRSLNALLDPHF